MTEPTEPPAARAPAPWVPSRCPRARVHTGTGDPGVRANVSTIKAQPPNYHRASEGHLGTVLRVNCIMGPQSRVSPGRWGQRVQPVTPLLFRDSRGSQELDFSGLESGGPRDGPGQQMGQLPGIMSPQRAAFHKHRLVNRLRREPCAASRGLPVPPLSQQRPGGILGPGYPDKAFSSGHYPPGSFLPIFLWQILG